MSVIRAHRYGVFTVLFLLCAMFLIKGCNTDRNPVETQEQGLTLKVTGSPELQQAKMTGITVLAEGLNTRGAPNGRDVVRYAMTDLPKAVYFSFEVPLMLYKRPCSWRIALTIALEREAPRTSEIEVNICLNTEARMQVETFENFQIDDSDPIDAPDPVIARTRITVTCGTDQISAPDSYRYPLSAELREEDGSSVSGPFDAQTVISGEFDDPYPQESLKTERTFTCTIRDGHSPDIVFTKTIERLPDRDGDWVADRDDNCLYTPNPDQADVDADGIGDACDCVVHNEDDSGNGSLRKVLDDAVSNNCSRITFLPEVSTVTLTSGQLTVPATTVTIDGSNRVTVSGNNSSRVFWVSRGADVIFEGLSITGGNADDGGGIYNDGGTVTIAHNCTIIDNTATNVGGGVNNNGGTLNVKGIINNNMSGGDGGGIRNIGGTITVSGTVSDNTATNWGGGIRNINGTLTLSGTVSGNAANNGGGVYNSVGTLVVSGTVSDNIANSSGGGIGNWDGAVTVSGTVSGNTANEYGGGIVHWAGGGPVVLASGNLIQENHSDNDNAGGETGGGIYMNGGGGCPVPGANYGSGNYRGSGTGTLDNCSP